jgi:hypothetical protein
MVSSRAGDSRSTRTRLARRPFARSRASCRAARCVFDWKTVYLAGPISGLNYDGATEWRIGFAGALAEVGIKGLSPMRAKEYLRDQYDASAASRRRARSTATCRACPDRAAS